MANIYVSVVQCPQTDHKETGLGLSLATSWLLRTPSLGPLRLLCLCFHSETCGLCDCNYNGDFVQSYMIRKADSSTDN